MSEFNEREIPDAWALRFDGYKYVEETGFDHLRAFERLDAEDVYPDRPEEQLALFFLLQRFLGKWGGERSSEQGRDWRHFRELFLMTHSYEVPARYRMDGWYERWARDCRPHAGEHVALVGRIHETAACEDPADLRREKRCL